MRINFNVAETKPYQGGYQVFPAGVYQVQIVKEEERDLKSGNGRALVFDYQITQGEYKGGTVKDFLNLNHTSEKARQIAEARLVAIARAVGIENFFDTQELFGRPFAVRLGVDKDYNGNDRNTIDEYKAVVTSAPTSAPVVTPQPQQAAQPAPFWS